MKKIGLSILSFGAVVALTSCNVFARHYWSWEKSTRNDTINYCLLIGQEDHNDSNDRTAGVRNQLGTRPTQHKPLANLEDPVTGHVTLHGNLKDVPAKEFTVHEIEHREQKSLAGTTWDPITANNSAATWTAKHGENITMFVSNNDGMAEGALGASCWYQGMPIFGYDANKSTLRFIQKNRIMGTIDSNTPSQCLTCAMLIRNICDHVAKNPNERWDPCSVGFKSFYGAGTDPDVYRTPYGFVNSNITFQGCRMDKTAAEGGFDGGEHAVLVDNYAITNFVDQGGYFTNGEVVPVNDYFNEDGSDKTPTQRVEKVEPEAHAYTPLPSNNYGNEKVLNVLHSYYSNTDVYFGGNMDPFFSYFFKGPTDDNKMLNMNVSRIDGDGTNEQNLVNAVVASVKGHSFDAFMLNIIKQPAAMLYIQEIAKALGIKEKEKWEDRDPRPVIFWNRQPTNDKGEISKDVMNNKYFKYTYYVGFGAKQGGDLQGKMVEAWLNNTYIENAKK